MTLRHDDKERRSIRGPNPRWKPARQQTKPEDLGPKFDNLFYCAFLHPEFFRDNGRIMGLSYCIVGESTNPRYVELEIGRKQ